VILFNATMAFDPPGVMTARFLWISTDSA
jgi:hypothetical protein